MSGSEAVAIIGVVDACIGLTERIIAICQAAKDSHGLPKKLKDLFEQLPTLQHLFEKAKQNNNNKFDINARKNAGSALENCEKALGQLEALFEAICPKADANPAKRIWKGASASISGKNSKLQELWKQIEGCLDTLEKEEIFSIGDELSGLKNAVISLAEEDSSKYTQNGPGHMYVTEAGGESYITGGGSKSFLQGATFTSGSGGTITFPQIGDAISKDQPTAQH